MTIDLDNQLDLGIDYLTLIIPITTHEDALTTIDCMSRVFSDAFEIHKDAGRFVGRQFGHWANSPNGALAVWNLPGENGEPSLTGSLRIALGGSVLSRATVVDTVRVISSSLAQGARCTRLDLKCDDFSRSMCPSLLEQACKDKNRTGFQTAHKTGDLSSNDLHEVGWTLYFGSRTSDRYTRYYNAKPVHGFEAWRYEVEFKNAVSHEVASMLCNTTDEDVLLLLIAANIAGNIKFIDRTVSVRADQCPMLPFWKDFVDRLGSSIRLSIPIIVPTIKRSIDWLETRVAATLAMVSRYYGYSQMELFKRLELLGMKKQTARHESILDAAAREPSRTITFSDDSFTVDYYYNG